MNLNEGNICSEANAVQISRENKYIDIVRSIQTDNE